MSKLAIPHSWEDIRSNVESHTTRRQRLTFAAAGIIMAGAGLIGLKSWADEVRHDRAVYNTYSDPSVGERVQNGEIDPNSVVPITAVPGDTAESIANRLGGTYEDRRNLTDELSNQAGEDGIQPGEVLYAPVEQINIYKAD